MDPVEASRPGYNNDEEIPMTLLTTSNTDDRLERQPETPSTVVAEAQSPLTLPVPLKLGSAAFAFVNDGSLGALLPYALRGYHISTGSVATLYGTAFAGWVVAALIGGYVRAHTRSGGALVLEANSQLVTFALRVWVSLANANWLEKLLLAETLTCVRCTGTTVRRLLCHVLARGLGSGHTTFSFKVAFVPFPCLLRLPLLSKIFCFLVQHRYKCHISSEFYKHQVSHAEPKQEPTEPRPPPGLRGCDRGSNQRTNKTSKTIARMHDAQPVVCGLDSRHESNRLRVLEGY
jgi:hypothetical protein